MRSFGIHTYPVIFMPSHKRGQKVAKFGNCRIAFLLFNKDNKKTSQPSELAMAKKKVIIVIHLFNYIT